MIGRCWIINIVTVPGCLCSIGISVDVLQLFDVELALTPLYELHHDVVVTITCVLTTFCTAIEIVHACEYVQLLVTAHDVTIHAEDILIHRAVGQVAVQRVVGVADTEGTIVINL